MSKVLRNKQEDARWTKQLGLPDRKNDRVSGNFFLLKKVISKLLNKLVTYARKNMILSSKYDFLRVSQNIYQLHNFSQIRVSLFLLGKLFHCTLP